MAVWSFAADAGEDSAPPPEKQIRKIASNTRLPPRNCFAMPDLSFQPASGCMKEDNDANINTA
jgi:hypothetical protein